MADSDFRRWVDLLERRTGLVVSDERRAFLVANVCGRMRELGIDDYGAYIEALESGPNGAREWATLVDRLTIHQTHFFRHRPSLEVVADMVVPRAADRGSRDLHAWSVGCATGEETYSVAMALDIAAEYWQANLRFGVVGSDVSKAAVAQAREGRYSGDKLEEIPPRYAERYCLPDGDGFVITPGLRKRCAFVLHNLLEVNNAPFRELDLIFCQNTLIYFPRERRRGILDGLAKALRPGGILLLGVGEITGYQHPDLQRLDNRRVLAFEKV